MAKHILLIGLWFMISNAVHAVDVVISKGQYVEAMKTALPNTFCSETQYFRKCFKVTEDECIQEALRATKVCLASVDKELPDRLHQPDDGRNWGTKIGKCAGTNYYTSLIKKKIASKDCENPEKWKKPADKSVK